MSEWSNPPKAKVYEALSALGDGRVNQINETRAEVLSSDKKKAYSVVWSPDGMTFSSNDNASYWQGYIGYPVIAVLMLLGRIRFSAAVAGHLSNVPWKKLNTKFKRDYERATDYVLGELASRGVAIDEIRTEVDSIYDQLVGLGIKRDRMAGVPPA